MVLCAIGHAARQRLDSRAEDQGNRMNANVVDPPK